MVRVEAFQILNLLSIGQRKPIHQTHIFPKSTTRMMYYFSFSIPTALQKTFGLRDCVSINADLSKTFT